jgi:hypothetical protein
MGRVAGNLPDPFMVYVCVCFFHLKKKKKKEKKKDDEKLNLT